MKKIFYLILLLAVIPCASCKTTEESTLESTVDLFIDENGHEYILVDVEKHGVCRYRRKFTFDNSIEAMFDDYRINENSTELTLPEFKIAGDLIEVVETERNYYPQFVHNTAYRLTQSISLSNVKSIEYEKAKVIKASLSSIVRNDDGGIKSIGYYTQLVDNIIITDKEYSYMDLKDYKGDDVYVSFAADSENLAIPYAFYSFDPLA